MTRIFTTLAVLAVAFLVLTLSIGLSIGNLYEHADGVLNDSSAIPRRNLHLLFGVACTLVVLLVNSVSITYFVGTSRWTKEVTAAYSLAEDSVRQATGLKRRCWPLAISGMLAMLAIVALGGAADPGTLRPGTEWWATPHMFGAMLGTGWIAISFMLQFNLIRTNYGVIAEVMRQVESKQPSVQPDAADDNG